MAVFHYVHLRTFAHETEDPERVVAAVRRAAQDDALAVGETVAEGGHGNRIRILEAEVKATAAVKRLFGALRRDDPAGFERVAATARERVDDHLNLHLRLDKQAAYQGRLALAADDDAIVVRGKIRSFGPKREGAAHEASLRQLEAFFLDVASPRGTPLHGDARTFKHR